MPCYADTIVRIKYVRRTERQDIKSLVVWALGTYPVERDDCEIEMVLFLPLESQERDLETQAIFERDSFYSVGGKVVPGYYKGNVRPKMTVAVSTGVVILNKAVNSNKCPLKISLIGIPQELPRIVGTDGNTVVNVLVNDYAGREYNFTVKVVFPYLNSQFAYLMNAIRPEDSFVLVVGQMEVICNEFYIYSKDINYIDVHFPFKQKVSDNNNNLEVSNTARSKLLSVHQNITKNSEESSNVETSCSTGSSEFIDNLHYDTSKHTRVESVDESTDFLDSVDSDNLNLDTICTADNVLDAGIEEPVKKKQCKRSVQDEKGKKIADRPLRSALRSHNPATDINCEKKK